MFFAIIKAFLTLIYIETSISAILRRRVMDEQALFRVVVDLCLLIVLAELSSTINARLKIPRIIGPLFTGIIFGPNLVGGIVLGGRPIIEFNDLVYIFSEIGAVMLLFSAGLHMRFSELMSIGLASTSVALVGVTVPYFLGLGAAVILGYSWYVGMIIGGSMAATSIAISLKCLEEMDKLETSEAKVILGAAVLDDVLALSLASVILAIIVGGRGVDAFEIMRLLGTTLVVWFLLTIVSSRLLPRIMNWVTKLGEIRIVEAVAILLCFGYASLSGRLGLSPLVGAFVAGMAIADSGCLERVKEFVETVEIFFVPLFFVVMGGSMNPRSLFTSDFALISVLSLVAIGSKLIGCGLPATFFLKDRNKALRVGFGMISRGEIGLVIASIGITYRIISNEVYTALILMIFVTSLIPPFLLRRSYLKEEKVARQTVSDEP